MGKPALTKKQIEIIMKLRQHGHSLPEIQRFTGHGKGTIHKYIRDVRILPKFIEHWRDRRKSSTYKMRKEMQRAEAEAKNIIQNSSNLNRVIIAVCLYWAKIIGISQSGIRNVNIVKGKKKGKLKYGMCRVRVVKSGYLLKVVKSLIDLMPNLAFSPYSSTDRIGHS